MKKLQFTLASLDSGILASGSSTVVEQPPLQPAVWSSNPKKAKIIDKNIFGKADLKKLKLLDLQGRMF
jgi:hypothetical protein